MVCFYTGLRGRAPKGILAFASATIASEKSTASTVAYIRARYRRGCRPAPERIGADFRRLVPAPHQAEFVQSLSARVITRIGSVARRRASVATLSLSLGRHPLLNRPTATSAVPQGFLAFLNRYLHIFGSGLESGGSACGSRRVAVERFRNPGRVKVALESLLKPCQQVALRPATTGRNVLRCHPERPQ